MEKTGKNITKKWAGQEKEGEGKGKNRRERECHTHTHSEMEGKHLECSDLKAKISRVGLVQEVSFAAGISNG